MFPRCSPAEHMWNHVYIHILQFPHQLNLSTHSGIRRSEHIRWGYCTSNGMCVYHRQQSGNVMVHKQGCRKNVTRVVGHHSSAMCSPSGLVVKPTSGAEETIRSPLSPLIVVPLFWERHVFEAHFVSLENIFEMYNVWPGLSFTMSKGQGLRRIPRFNLHADTVS